MHMTKVNRLSIVMHSVEDYVIVAPFQKIFPWLICKIDHQPVSKFSNRVITSGMCNNNRRLIMQKLVDQGRSDIMQLSL